jgi:hypothetical protein
VRPRKGSAAICSRCHQPAPGYDQLAERRYEFIPLWGFFVFLLYAMRRMDCLRCGAVEHVVTWGLEHRALRQIDAIGVDEIQYAKGHKYLTLVYQITWEPT